MSSDDTSEAVEIGLALEEAYKPVAKAKHQEGVVKGGKKGKRGVKNNSGGSSPTVKRDESARTTAVAAKAVGMDRRYRIPAW